jgi:hypothetical protein
MGPPNDGQKWRGHLLLQSQNRCCAVARNTAVDVRPDELLLNPFGANSADLHRDRPQAPPRASMTFGLRQLGFPRLLRSMVLKMSSSGRVPASDRAAAINGSFARAVRPDRGDRSTLLA